MQLTLWHMFKKTVPGHIFRGKRRLVKQVTPLAKAELLYDYERQEANMLFLRHPYLTVEESHGHAKELGKKAKLVEKWKNEKTLSKLKPNITLEDRLYHLKVKESWD